jgi:hypothetical protein
MSIPVDHADCRNSPIRIPAVTATHAADRLDRPNMPFTPLIDAAARMSCGMLHGRSPECAAGGFNPA